MFYAVSHCRVTDCRSIRNTLRHMIITRGFLTITVVTSSIESWHKLCVMNVCGSCLHICWLYCCIMQSLHCVHVLSTLTFRFIHFQVMGLHYIPFHVLRFLLLIIIR